MKALLPWLLGGLLIGASFAVGQYFFPKEVEKEVLRYVDREVVKVVTKDVVHVVNRTRLRTITKKDGTIITEHTTTASDSSTSVKDRTDTTEAIKEATKTTPRPPPNWTVSALAGLDVPKVLELKVVPVYGAHVQRRVLGPVHVGVWGLSNGVGGISAGFVF